MYFVASLSYLCFLFYHNVVIYYILSTLDMFIIETNGDRQVWRYTNMYLRDK
jgi:hypothetical protein